MEKQTVFVLELDGLKAVYTDIEGLKQAIEIAFDNLHDDDFKYTIFKVYAKKMIEQEIDELPEFDGF